MIRRQSRARGHRVQPSGHTLLRHETLREACVKSDRVISALLGWGLPGRLDQLVHRDHRLVGRCLGTLRIAWLRVRLLTTKLLAGCHGRVIDAVFELRHAGR